MIKKSKYALSKCINDYSKYEYPSALSQMLEYDQLFRFRDYVFMDEIDGTVVLSLSNEV